MSDQSQQGNPPSYDQSTLPTYQQATQQTSPPAYSPYSSYMGSYGTSPYAMPYGGSYYPPSSSTTSMGTAYGDGKGALTQAEALNTRTDGQLHAYKDQAEFDKNKELESNGIQTAEMAAAMAIAGGAVGAAAGSIRSTKLNKHGQPVDAHGNVVSKENAVKTTSKGKGAVIGLLVGLGAGAGWSLFNRN
jgi:hypothetical protein